MGTVPTFNLEIGVDEENLDTFVEEVEDLLKEELDELNYFTEEKLVDSMPKGMLETGDSISFQHMVGFSEYIGNRNRDGAVIIQHCVDWSVDWDELEPTVENMKNIKERIETETSYDEVDFVVTACTI